MCLLFIIPQWLPIKFCQASTNTGISLYTGLVCYNYMVEGYHQLCINLLNNSYYVNLKSFWSETKKNMRVQFSIYNQPLFRIFNVYLLLDGRNEMGNYWYTVELFYSGHPWTPQKFTLCLGCPKIQEVSSILGIWNREVSLHTGESLVYQLSNIFGELMYWEFVV